MARVNRPETEAELAAVRQAVVRGRPFGSPAWQEKTTRRLGLEFTLRRRGRPIFAEWTAGRCRLIE